MKIFIGVLASLFIFGAGQAAYRYATGPQIVLKDHLAKGREIMKHFDKDIPLTKEAAREALSKARDAYAEFLHAKAQGLDPGWELHDAQIKWEFWNENLQKIEQAELEITTELAQPTYR